MSFRTFEIPSVNLPTFQSKWAKLVKRAQKLGITEPTYRILGERFEKVRLATDLRDHNDRVVYEEKALVFSQVKIEHPIVKVAGWECIASLEHTTEGNVIRNVGGQDLPIQYRDCLPNCDHCKTTRRRNDTYILRSAEPMIEGDSASFSSRVYKQVGSTCLTDFLGVNAEHFASMAELYSLAGELGEASESGDFGGSGTLDYLDTYLSHCAEVISLIGWKSRSSAKEESDRFGRTVVSTSDIAFSHMHPSPYRRAEDKLYDLPSNQSRETAKLAIEWCESLPDSEVEASEYLHNIRLIAKRGVLGARQYGFGASIVSAYKRFLNDQLVKERRAKQSANSQYVGVVGKRQDITVVVEKVLQFDSAYGSMSLHIMTDESGNRMIWKSSSKVLETGRPIQIKASIKKHEERQGVCQTILIRCVESK